MQDLYTINDLCIAIVGVHYLYVNQKETANRAR
jgi:hypothetical protein